MYARLKNAKNKDGSLRTYLYVCESVRRGKKVSQKLKANLGRVDKLGSLDGLKDFALSLLRLCPELHVLDAANDLAVKSGKEFGTIAVFRHIWEKLKLDKILADYLEDTRLSFDAAEAIFSMVVNRLSEPASKLGMYKHWLGTTYEPKWQEFDLQHFYRAMDFLTAHQHELAKDIVKETKRCFKTKINVVMFDCTTVLSYGQTKSESDLLQNGYSKVKRMDLPQVLVGLVMSEEGIPLGYEVWQGNHSERVGFAQVITKIKSTYQINQVVVVCDRGMISKKNLQALEDLKLNYILGVRMRQLSTVRQDALLADVENYRLAKDHIYVQEWSELDLLAREERAAKEKSYANFTQSIVRYMASLALGLGHLWGLNPLIKTCQDTLEVLAGTPLTDAEREVFAKRKYVACYNPETAKEDAEKREYFKTIIEKKLDYASHKYWIVRNGYKKYLMINQLEMQIDYAKLERESVFDGKWVLVTNTGYPSASIAFAYQNLWQIERHFRTLKSELALGPLNHWTEKRIKAHVCICFLALLLRTYLEKKIKDLQPELSVTDVIAELKTLQVVPLSIGTKQLALRTELTPNMLTAFKAIGAKLPPKTLPLN